MCTAGGKVKWCSHRGKSFSVPQKIKNGTTIWSSSFTSRCIYPSNLKEGTQNRYLHTSVHSNIIHINQKWKKPKSSAREEWINNIWSVPTMRCHPALWKWVSKILTQATTWVPSLWDLMPDDLRWSWYNNNGNKVHNKCNALESPWNHPPTGPWKNHLLGN